MHMPEEIKTSAETLNSTSHRGSVRDSLIVIAPLLSSSL